MTRYETGELAIPKGSYRPHEEFRLYPKGSGSHKSILGREVHSYVYVCDDSFPCNVRNDLGEEGSIF